MKTLIPVVLDLATEGALDDAAIEVLAQLLVDLHEAEPEPEAVKESAAK